MPRRHLIALLLAAGAAAVLLARERAHRDRPARHRIAVAVFANRTGDASLEPLGSMAADWVTRGLDQLAGAEVVDVGAVLAQNPGDGGEPEDPVVLARRNGAGTVVSGSYYLATDTLVVRATLVDAVSGTVLQTVPPVHASAGEAVRALEQLRQHVVGALAGVLDTRFTSLTARPAAPRSFAAYQAFVAGLAAYWQGRPAGEARSLLQRAAEADSTFHTAAVWLAFVGANGAGCGLTDSVAGALASRRSALTAFDRLTLDLSAAKCLNDWEGGYQLAREQAELPPRSTYATYTAGVFALHSGHFRSAVELLGGIAPGRDLGWLTDPAKMIYWRDYQGARHLTGAYRDELREAERLVREFPDRAVARLFAGRALAALGRGRAALTHLEVALRLPPDQSARVAGGLSGGHIATLLAMELQAHGDTTAARAAAQRAVDWYQESPADRLGARYERYYLARSLARLGRYDEAVAAVAFRAPADSSDILYLGLEGMLAVYRGDTRTAAEADAKLAGIRHPAAVGVVASQRARIAAALGDLDRALDLQEQGWARGIPRVPTGMDLHHDWAYDPMRGNPRFERIIRGRD